MIVLEPTASKYGNGASREHAAVPHLSQEVLFPLQMNRLNRKYRTEMHEQLL